MRWRAESSASESRVAGAKSPTRRAGEVRSYSLARACPERNRSLSWTARFALGEGATRAGRGRERPVGPDPGRRVPGDGLLAFAPALSRVPPRPIALRGRVLRPAYRPCHERPSLGLVPGSPGGCGRLVSAGLGSRE